MIKVVQTKTVLNETELYFKSQEEFTQEICFIWYKFSQEINTKVEFLKE